MASYGKRPIWQWVLIYIVVGLVVYGAIYYFFFASKGGGYGSSSSQTPTYGLQTAPQSDPQTAPQSGSGNGY